MNKALRQEIRQLKHRKERTKQRKVMVEGEKCIRELCRSSWAVERIYYTNDWDDAPLWDLNDEMRSVPRMLVGKKDMALMSALKTPPGLLAIAPWPLELGRLPSDDGMSLFLDDVTDPGNVGTLIRVADWFGLSGVIMSPRCADALGPKAIQSAMGSTFHVSLAMESFSKIPDSHKRNVVGLDMGGQNLFGPGLPDAPSLLVIGSESHGLSPDIKEACHSIASIPGAGRAESLNASVAGAIATSAFLQQRLS